MQIGSHVVQISGSTVLLTGASGGIGQAVARALSVRGAQLILTGRRTEALAALAAECSARTVAVDLAERDAPERLAGEAGAVDILVANAGLPAAGRLETFTVPELDRALDVNLRAPIVLAHALLPGMIERGRGHLVFMSSLSGKATAPATAVYGATKFGLRGLAGGLRADLRGTGVGVSAVFPGFIREAGMFSDSGVSLPRGIGTRSPEDVASAVVTAIEQDRAEVDVAPLSMRLGAVFAGVAPDSAARLARRLGGGEVAAGMDAGLRSKR